MSFTLPNWLGCSQNQCEIVQEDHLAGKTRRYHAPTRAAQARATRARVLAAAHDLFVRRGFATTVAEIANEAGVSQATVEFLFGTKAILLNAVIDVTLAGDDEPVPMLERPWVAEVAGLNAPEFLTQAAAAFAAGAGRVSPLLRALDEGASAHADLAELDERLERQRAVMAAWVITEVTARSSLAEDLDVEQATQIVLVLLDPLVHRRLLVERGWTVDDLAHWFARAWRRLLLDPVTS